MSYQYDIEDQADLTGVVMTEGLDWREQYVPVAPVQLTRAWSPLPLAVELLGPPDWTSVGEAAFGARPAACAWRCPRSTARPAGAVDVVRFHRLLAVATVRANDVGRGVLIVTKPGWCYDHATISVETAGLMREVGFAVGDRHG
jgi:hypothetical protein